MSPKSVDNGILIHRFSDIATEPLSMLMPIEGYEKMPLVSLEDAVEPLVTFVSDVQQRVRIEKQRCENPSDNLSPDESAAIALYTTEWESGNDSLYFILNSTLRAEDRMKLQPWFLYLKLLLTALSHLPTIAGHTVYRGIKRNMSHMYPEERIFTWWGFSSCATSIKVLENQKFFGKTGKRTLFVINCYSGRSIHRHAYIENGNENEALLSPGIQFKVVACLNQDHDLHVIQLQEVEPVSPRLGPLPAQHITDSESSASESSTQSLFTTLMPLFKTKIPSSVHETYQNLKLQKRIAKCEPGSLIDLDRQFLTDQDIPIVVQQAVINKQCTRLRLSDNKITSQGASVLAEALHHNTKLEGLYIFNNQVADKGVYSLAQVLSERKLALTTLSLGWNDITDEGAGYLAEMLKTNTTLIELWLPWNRISDQGVQLLANVLIHHNTSLQRLSLDLNKLVSDLCVDSLIDVMNQNQSLTALHLRDCKLSKVGKAKLREVAKSKQNFELNL